MNLEEVFIGHPLHFAALIGQVNKTKELLDDGEDPNELFLSKSPLHYAMGLGLLMEVHVYESVDFSFRIQIAKMLLDCGARIDSTDKLGRSPLINSIRSNHHDNIELVQFLLENGSDPLIQDKDGHTPFHHACDYKRPNTFALLLKYAPPVTEFPLGNDRRTLLHLTALCSKDMFDFILESTDTDYINKTCSVISEERSDDMLSLPCCLMQNRNLKGIQSLLDKEGVSKSVLNCPIVSQLCRGVYSPIAYSFVKDTFSDFALEILDMYIGHNLPIDPEITESFGDIDASTCLEILADVHEFHTTNNLEETCKCARLFIILLKNGARVKPYHNSNNYISNRLLKFICFSGSIFSIIHLLNKSDVLEPHIILKCFISMIISNMKYTIHKNSYKIIQFLVNLSSPEHLNEIRKYFSMQSHPALHRILNSLTFETLPSLKNLCRTVVRDQAHKECPDNLFLTYISILPLPRTLISFLKYEDFVLNLESQTGYPSFDLNIIST